MVSGGKFVIVYADYHGFVFAFCRSSDDNLFSTCFNMVDKATLWCFLFGEESGGFNHDINAHSAPRKLGRIAFFKNFDGLTCNDK